MRDDVHVNCQILKLVGNRQPNIVYYANCIFRTNRLFGNTRPFSTIVDFRLFTAKCFRGGRTKRDLLHAGKFKNEIKKTPSFPPMRDYIFDGKFNS